MKKFPKLHKGDLFLSRNPMWLGRMINGVQTFNSKDNNSEYSHAGIIVDSDGTTFESLWTIKNQNLFEAYKGQKIMVVRYKGMVEKTFDKAYKELYEEYNGDWYPMHRLIFHLFRPLAKYIHPTNRPVCSELDGLLLYKVGARHEYAFGTNVDVLADEFTHYAIYEIMYEDVCPNKK